VDLAVVWAHNPGGADGGSRTHLKITTVFETKVDQPSVNVLKRQLRPLALGRTTFTGSHPDLRVCSELLSPRPTPTKNICQDAAVSFSFPGVLRAPWGGRPTDLIVHAIGNKALNGRQNSVAAGDTPEAGRSLFMCSYSELRLSLLLPRPMPPMPNNARCLRRWPARSALLESEKQEFSRKQDFLVTFFSYGTRQWRYAPDTWHVEQKAHTNRGKVHMD
jgi:hypothetical protein